MVEEKAGKIERRHFMLSIGWGSLFVVFGGMIVETMRYIFPNVLYELVAFFKAGKPNDYPNDSVTFLAERKVFVFRNKEGLHAISAICTHLGCTVRQEKDGFFCPCHGSGFDKNGLVLYGPAPKPLPWLSIVLNRKGDLVIDTAKHVSIGYTLKV